MFLNIRLIVCKQNKSKLSWKIMGFKLWGLLKIGRALIEKKEIGLIIDNSGKGTSNSIF